MIPRRPARRLDPMAYGKVDIENILPVVLLPIAAASEFAIFQFANAANSLFTFKMSDVLISLTAGTDLTIAMVVYLGSLAGIVVQGQLDGAKFSDEEWYLIVGTFSIVPLYQLIPAFGSFVDGIPILANILFLGVATSAVLLSYRG